MASSTVPSGSGIAVNYNCARCHQPGQKDDGFCGTCGYSKMKCAACRKKLRSEGRFCPGCGAARDGQQIVRISPAVSRGERIVGVLKTVVAPILVVVIAACIVKQPAVHRSTAQAFFDNYFAGVTNGKHRSQLYAQDLSASFKQNPSLLPSKYNGYWGGVRSVTVDSVFSVSGNTDEFNVTLTINPKRGDGILTQVYADYWLICTGFIGQAWGKVPGWSCPEGDLKIDNQQFAKAPGAA